MRVVNVAVVVTDRQGRPLTDLRRDDFELFVDKEATEIAYFSRIVEGRLDESSRPAPEFAEPAEEVIEPSRERVTWAIFYDQREVKPARRTHALREISESLERGMAKGDRAIAATFDGRYLRVHRAATEDRAGFVATLSTLEKTRRAPSYAAAQRIHLPRDIRQAAGDEEGAMHLADQVSVQIDLEAQEIQNGIHAMMAFADVLAGLEGRSAILYVGAGFNILPGIAISNLWHQRFPQHSWRPWAPRPDERSAELTKVLDSLFARLSAARITLYTIYTGEPAPGVTSEDAVSPISEGGPPSDAFEFHQMGLARELAERTGGRFFKGNLALREPLASIRDELTHYYSLGYVPKTPVGREQKLRVRVKVEGAQVRYRESVRERTAEEQAGDAAVTALFHPAQDNPLGVTLETDPPRQGKRAKDRLLPLRVKVPLASLALLPDGALQRGSVTFHFALAGDDGALWRLDSRELPLEVAPSPVNEHLTQHLTYAVEVPLLGDGMRLSVSVQDSISKVRSVVVLPLGKATL